MAYEYEITNKRYHTLDYYFKTKYGKKVFKIPLNASFTCPNRDGTKGYGGCDFCSSKGSGDSAGDSKLSLIDQYYQMLNIMHKKWPEANYMIYFQAFSNTYGSLEKLKQTYEQFINLDPKIIGMSIATRPDCINKKIFDYLKTLKANFKEFWVELGLETANKKIADSLNIGYDFNDFENAVKLLSEAKIPVVVHIINGLPHESKISMISTIKKINKLPIFGIKFHALNILKGTKLAEKYQNKPFKLLTLEEYIDIVIEQLQYLKGNIVVHRISGDSLAELLIAPLWVYKKLSLSNLIDQKMNELDVYQGEKFI